jgi:hypothetical protein
MNHRNTLLWIQILPRDMIKQRVTSCIKFIRTLHSIERTVPVVLNISLFIQIQTVCGKLEWFIESSGY